MNPEDLLQASLLDLLYELEGTDIRLILGGGYGLYQKRLYAIKAQQVGARLVITPVPPARSTNDLDLFLRTEIIADAAQAKQLRDALDRLGYTVIEKAKFYQFVRPIAIGSATYEVKVDFLTKRPDITLFPTLRVDSRRVRLKQSLELHAHTTEEAAAIEEMPLEITLEGQKTNGETYMASLFVPHAYPFLMMKLFAFRDQKDNPEKEFGREHAFDIFTLVSILTEDEFETAKTLAAQYASLPVAKEAAAIVSSLFGEPSALGLLRLQEHRFFSRTMDMERFVTILTTIF